MSDEPKELEKKGSINRRSYLKAAAGAAGIATFGLNAGATGGDYEVIEVGAGETFRKNLSDGDVWENTIVDITATGAAYKIKADGSGWEIRNIGVRGTFDTHDNDSYFNVRVPNSNGSGIIENVYLPGASSAGHSYDGPTGIYVFRDHAGDILIRNVNIKRMQDNGIYASSPGHDASSAYGGTVRVEGSYFEANATSQVRLGTSRSYIENSVMKDAVHRGYWAYYEHTELRGCDIFSSGSADIRLGGTTYDKQNYAEVTAEDSCWGTVTHAGSTELHGSSAGTPQDRVPEGCPTTPEEAAAGGGSSESVPSLPEGDFELEISTDGDLAEYLIELDAEEVAAGEGADTHDHEYQDKAFERNGNWYVHGYTGGGSERFRVTNGEILRIGELQGSPVFTADGRRLDTEPFDSISSVPEEGSVEDSEEEEGSVEDSEEEEGSVEDSEEEGSVEDSEEEEEGSVEDSEDEQSKLPNTIVIDGSSADEVSLYKFTVTESIEPDLDRMTVDDEKSWYMLQDNASESSVVGTVGEGQDAYVYSGKITELVLRGNATVTLKH